jgi:hypothetical protein
MKKPITAADWDDGIQHNDNDKTMLTPGKGAKPRARGHGPTYTALDVLIRCLTLHRHSPTAEGRRVHAIAIRISTSECAKDTTRFNNLGFEDINSKTLSLQQELLCSTRQSADAHGPPEPALTGSLVEMMLDHFPWSSPLADEAWEYVQKWKPEIRDHRQPPSNEDNEDSEDSEPRRGRSNPYGKPPRQRRRTHPYNKGGTKPQLKQRHKPNIDRPQTPDSTAAPTPRTIVEPHPDLTTPYQPGNPSLFSEPNALPINDEKREDRWLTHRARLATHMLLQKAVNILPDHPKFLYDSILSSWTTDTSPEIQAAFDKFEDAFDEFRGAYAAYGRKLKWAFATLARTARHTPQTRKPTVRPQARPTPTCITPGSSTTTTTNTIKLILYNYDPSAPRHLIKARHGRSPPGTDRIKTEGPRPIKASRDSQHAAHGPYLIKEHRAKNRRATTD